MAELDLYKSGNSPESDGTLDETAHALREAIRASDFMELFNIVKQRLPVTELLPFILTDSASELNESMENATDSKDAPDREQRMRRLQQILINLAPYYFEPNADEKLTPGQSPADWSKAVADLRTGVERESTNNEFGQETEKAFRSLIKWINEAVPATIRHLATKNLPIPPGCPIRLTTSDGSYPTPADIFKDLQSWSLETDSKDVPSQKDIDSLADMIGWLDRSSIALAEHQRKLDDARIQSEIVEFSLPKSYADPDGRQPARQVIDLLTSTRNHIEAMQTIAKMARYNDFPISLPRGSEVLVEYHGETIKFTDATTFNEEARMKFEAGTIKQIKLALPTDLRLEAPANQTMIKNLQQWLDKHGPAIEQAVREITTSTPVLVGEMDAPKGAVLFAPDGTSTALTTREHQPKPGEHLESINMLSYDVNVRRIHQGEHAGKYEVTQTVQAKTVPLWGYQNLIAQDVGTPVGTTQIVAPDDFIPVKAGHAVQLVKAKNLESLLQTQRVYNGTAKLTSISLDALMTLSGTIEMAALIGKSCGLIGKTLPVLSRVERTWEAGKIGTRLGLGGTGAFNNAGAREHEWGRSLNDWRHKAFMADITLNMLGASAKLMRAGNPVAASSGQKVHEIIYGAGEYKGVSALSVPHQLTGAGFRVSEFMLAGQLVPSLLQPETERNQVQQLARQLGDGRGAQLSERNSFNMQEPRLREGTERVLDGYCRTLSAGCSEETGKALQELFKKTQEVLSLEHSNETRRAFYQELLRKQTFSAPQITALEKHVPVQPGALIKSVTDRLAAVVGHSLPEPTGYTALSTQQLSELRNSEARTHQPKQLADAAATILAQSDKRLAIAEQIALLYLSRNVDGELPEILGTVELSIPKEKATHNVKQEVRTSNLVSELRTQLEKSEDPPESIAIGEVLARLGSISYQQYGSTLQDILNNSKSSRTDKLNALTDLSGPRMATVTDVARTREISSQLTGVYESPSYGLSFEAFMKTLEGVARHDADPDVRATAGLMWYGLSVKDAADKTVVEKSQRLEYTNDATELATVQAELHAAKEKLVHATQFLSNLNVLCANNKDQPNAINRQVREFLQSMTPGKPMDKHGSRDTDQSIFAVLAEAMIVNDKSNDVVAAGNLAKTVRAGDPAQAAMVLRVVEPDTRKQLQKSDPTAMNRLITELVNILKKEPNPGDVRTITEIISFVGEHATGNQLPPTIAALETMLQKPAFYQYPELVSGAINTLAKHGSFASLDLIRWHANPFDPDKNEGQQSPQVRKAALEAMDRLNDPELRQRLSNLISKENDPTVASLLHDIYTKEKRIDPNSQEWAEIARLARTKNIGLGPDYDYLTQRFDEKAAKEWLLDNEFGLLFRDQFYTQAKDAIANANSTFQIVSTFSKYLSQAENAAFCAKEQERNEQFERLKSTASGAGEDGNRALKILSFIIAQSGWVMGLPEQASMPGWWDSSMVFRGAMMDWQESAAHHLRDLCKGKNAVDKKVLKHLVLELLNGNANLRPDLRQPLLDGYMALASGGQIASNEKANTIAEALKFELGRARQSPEYQRRLIGELRQIRHFASLPVVKEVLESGQLRFDPAIRKECQDMCDELMHSVEAIWNSTEPANDNTNSPEQRAARLEQSLGRQSDSYTTVQQMFAAYKGYAISDPKDPALPQLSLALSDRNDRVRIAAAQIMLTSKLPNENAVKLKAMAALTEILGGSSVEQYRREAYRLLNSVQFGNQSRIMISSAKGLIELSRSNALGDVRATIYSNVAGRLKPSGYIYPGGSTFVWSTDQNNQINAVTEDGVCYQRQMESDQLTNRWINTATKSVWKGAYSIPDNELTGNSGPTHTYQFRTEGAAFIYKRTPTGQWEKVATEEPSGR